MCVWCVIRSPGIYFIASHIMQVDVQFDKESKKATAIFITGVVNVVQSFGNTRDLEIRRHVHTHAG